MTSSRNRRTNRRAEGNSGPEDHVGGGGHAVGVSRGSLLLRRVRRNTGRRRRGERRIRVWTAVVATQIAFAPEGVAGELAVLDRMAPEWRGAARGIDRAL